MSDTAYTVFQHYGTNAQRTAFTPSPPATGQPIYLWYETDTDTTWAYTTSWHQISGSGGGVTASGTLTANNVILGNGTSVVKALGSLGTTTTVLHGNAGGAPTFAQVSLTADVSGTLPVANGGTGATTLAGAGLMVRLSQVVTSASQPTVDFSSISSAYTTLRVLWIAKDTTAGNSASTIYLKVNNDGTSGNYTSSYFTGASNGTASSGSDSATANGMPVGNITNAGTTSQAGSGEATIVGYAQTTFFKPVRFDWANFNTTNNGTLFREFGTWKSTAAINQLTFTAGTAFTDGSIFTLYGIP